MAMQATVLINESGPLPKTASVTGPGMLLVSGSGYTADTGTIGMQVQLDGTDVADAQVCANSTETHMAFVSQYVLITDDQKHTLTLSPWSNTITDENDYFVVAFLPQDPGARVR